MMSASSVKEKRGRKPKIRLGLSLSELFLKEGGQFQASDHEALKVGSKHQRNYFS